MMLVGLQARLLALGALSLAVVGLAWYTYGKGETAGKTEVQSRWDAEKVLVFQANAEVVAQAAVNQVELEKKISKLEKDQTHEKARISADYKRIIAGLRDRPDAAPSDLASVPEAGASGVEPSEWGTGARLLRQHGEFLAGEASLAAELQAALKTCLASR